jgi:phosphatidylinositol glycan class B
MSSPHWLMEPVRTPSRVLRHWFLVLLVFHIVTAFFSYGIFHCDEHFQIIEFIGYKLGWVSASGLAWEFESQIRPWLQPFLFYLPAKALVGFGFKDPLVLEMVLRLLSGLLGWGSLAVLSRSIFHFLERTQKAFWIVLLFSSFYFLPQFHVRTSSESMSTAFLMLAFALCLKPSVSALHFAGVGFLLGLSFEARYQTAIAGVGLALWLFLTTTKKIHCAVYGTLGGLAAMLLGALADFWGYGNWVFPAYRYATVNLVEGKAASFGVSPWWDYFVTFPKKFIGPYRFLVLAGAIAAILYPLKFIKGLRFSRPSDAEPVNRLSLALVSIILPFLVVHSMIGHKEERFLYPVVWSLWLLAILQIGLPVHQSVSKEANPYKWLRAAFYLHAALTAVLLLRGATLQLNPLRDIFAALQVESEKSPVVLRVDNGENPYSLGCAGKEDCGATVVSEFLQPKNLQVRCTSDDGLSLSGQFYLKSYSEIPSAQIAFPQGCKMHTSTLPSWGAAVAQALPDSWSRLVFKNFRFHVLWDCR